MNTKRAGVISILAIALVLVGVIGYQAFKPEQVKAATQSLVGSWMATVTPDGMPSFADIIVFSSDGTAIEMINDGRPGIGVWQKLSHNRYAFSVWEYWTGDDALLYSARVTSTIELSRDKDQYTGPFFFQVYDSAGNLIVEGPGIATGVRQQLETMPDQTK